MMNRRDLLASGAQQRDGVESTGVQMDEALQATSTQMSDALQTPAFARGDRVQDFEDTELYETAKYRMRNKNDMIIMIAPSSKTSGSGTGKTTLGIQLARALDHSDSPFKAADQASLDAYNIANDLYPDLPKKHPILWDESQGTMESDGADARRAMASEVIRVSRAAVVHRWKQMPLIIIAQNTKWMDQRMMDIIDRLLLIVEVDHDSGIARAVSFDHYYDDLPQKGSAQSYTPAIEDIYWRPLPSDDPDYRHMHKLKKESGDTSVDDETRELTQEQRAELARWLVEEKGWSQADAAEVPLIDRSQSWVSNNI